MGWVWVGKKRTRLRGKSGAIPISGTRGRGNFATAGFVQERSKIVIFFSWPAFLETREAAIWRDGSCCFEGGFEGEKKKVPGQAEV